MNRQSQTHGGPLYRLKRWMYPDDRPNAVARLLNRIAAWQHATGFLAPPNWVTLEVRGRRSGRVISFPLVVADHEGERYLVAMLGERTNWVHNVRAAEGSAVLRRGRRTPVRLLEVDPKERPPILKRYLEVAPGARPHIPVDRRAPLAEFELIASEFPVFRIAPSQAD